MEKFISFGDQALIIRYPVRAAEAVDFIFADFPTESNADPITVIEIFYDQDAKKFSVTTGNEEIGRQLDHADLALFLLTRTVYTVTHGSIDGMAIHGAAVRRNDRAVLMAGDSDSGKSILTAWLLEQGYGYLTDKAVYLHENNWLSPLPCPLSLRQKSLPFVSSAVKELLQPGIVNLAANSVLRNSTGLLFSHRIFTDNPVPDRQKLALLLFPEYKKDAPLSLKPIKSGQAAQQLMRFLANHHKLGVHGFTRIAALTRKIPALSLQYADYNHLEDTLPPIIDFVLDTQCGPQSLRRFIKAVSRLTEHPRKVQKKFPLQQATPPGKKRKFTVGMSTYDDFDGVYFSIQALRMYHPEIIDQWEILVIDNHPDGPCAESLKQLDASIDGYRYIPLSDMQGTSAGRDALFQHAAGDYVLCMDCHVFLVPGALKKLTDYFTAHPDSDDLLQGPMLDDDLQGLSTHFQPIWRDGMYGIWGHDPRGDDPAGKSFAVPMQGLGLFACRKAAWPGFNTHFYGFGGEEGYIHEKFCQAGGRTLCLPFLRWLHRFDRPMGVPYPVEWKDRIHNYLVGFTELGLDTAPIREHFRELLGGDQAEAIFREVDVSAPPIDLSASVSNNFCT